MQEKRANIRPHEGKLLVLLPGLGAVATTFMAGVEAMRRGHALPIGSLTHSSLLSETLLRETALRERRGLWAAWRFV